MKFIIENFSNITSENNILSDISENFLPTPLLDKANYNIKNKMDNLIKKIINKKNEILNLQDKINEDALNTVTNINRPINLSGHNIFFTSVPRINIYKLLKPITIIMDEETKLLPNLNTNSPLNAEQSELGFNLSLYELGIISYKQNNIAFAGFPIPPAIIENKNILENLVENTAQINIPNRTMNKNFHYNIFSSKPDFSKRIDDFNLNYNSILPYGLQGSNFLTIGLNGHIYVGTEVNYFNKSGNFLDELIKYQFITAQGQKYWSDTNIDFRPNENLFKKLQAQLSWFSLLTIPINSKTEVSGLPFGPEINEKRGIAQTFLVGGTLPYTFKGCFKIRDPRIISEKQEGTFTVDECVALGSQKGASFASIQNGGPGGRGNENFTNGECWLSNKSFNQFPPCQPAFTIPRKRHCSGWGPFRKCKTKPAQNFPETGMCPSNDCKGIESGSPQIGNLNGNALYQINNAPLIQPARIYLQGCELGLFKPGTLVFEWTENGKLNREKIWEPEFFINKEILFPFDSNKTRGVTEITNILDNGNANYIWSKDNKNQVLYSKDYYFKLVINSKINRNNPLTNSKISKIDFLKELNGKKFAGFMNSSNAINSIQSSLLTSVFDYQDTGIKINLNTDLEKYTNENHIKSLFKIFTIYAPDSITTNSKNYQVVYEIPSLNNEIIGRMGFVNYNPEINSEKNLLNINLYSEKLNKNFSNNTGRFINIPGSINKNTFPNISISDFYTNLRKNINELPNAKTEMECMNTCYSNLDTCQAWEFNQNTCWNYNSKTNDVKNLIEAQIPSNSFNKELRSNTFNIRIPEIKNNINCPNTINKPLISADIPGNIEGINNSIVNFNNKKRNMSYTIENKEFDENNICNVAKIINENEKLLNTKEKELEILLNEFNALVNSLDKKQQEIFSDLLKEEEISIRENKKINKIKKDIAGDNSLKDQQKTLEQNIEVTALELINNNYRFLFWTILAIIIVISGIQLSRKIKK